MCKDCDNFHSNLFSEHHLFNLQQKENIEEIFTCLCKEQNHNVELEFYCKTHNQLCCAKCITSIKEKGNGEHKECDICFIEDYEEEKKNKLNENIKNLEDILLILEKSIADFKQIVLKITESKEEALKEVQKMFTSLRNTINAKEDELLAEIEKRYKYTFLNDDNITYIEKFTNKNKLLLEKNKSNDYDWKKNKLNSLINDCINVENNIFEINKINNVNDNLKKLSSLFFQIQIKWDQDNFNKGLETIENFSNNTILFNSKIEIDENLIKSWLDNKNFIAELLFRKTEDGSSSKDFHKKCDNQGNTIIFIETTKGNKFGGYTELGQEGLGAKKDKNTFLFSFDNKEKYIAKNDFNTIYCENKYGPIFRAFEEKNKPIKQEKKPFPKKLSR